MTAADYIAAVHRHLADRAWPLDRIEIATTSHRKVRTTLAMGGFQNVSECDAWDLAAMEYSKSPTSMWLDAQYKALQQAIADASKTRPGLRDARDHLGTRAATSLSIACPSVLCEAPMHTPCINSGNDYWRDGDGVCGCGAFYRLVRGSWTRDRTTDPGWERG